MYCERSFVLCMDAQECDFIKSPAFSENYVGDSSHDALNLPIRGL